MAAAALKKKDEPLNAFLSRQHGRISLLTSFRKRWLLAKWLISQSLHDWSLRRAKLVATSQMSRPEGDGQTVGPITSAVSPPLPNVLQCATSIQPETLCFTLLDRQCVFTLRNCHQFPHNAFQSFTQSDLVSMVFSPPWERNASIIITRRQ